MALQDHLLAEKANIIALLEAEYSDQNLREELLQRLFYIRQLLGELAADVGSITVTGGDASAANQTNVQANAGADASKALSIQGITGGKALDVNVTDSFALETGGNLATIAAVVGTDGSSTPSRTLLVGGVYDGTIQTIKVDNQGRVLLNPTDQQTKADSVSVTIASDQGNLGNITNVTGTISLPTGAATSAKQDTGNNSLASIDGKLPSLGQASTAASIPVVLPDSQIAALTPLSSIGVSSLPSLPAGGNTIGAISNTTFAATQSGTWNIGNLPSSLGAKSAANSLAVTLATDGVASGIANQIGEVQASPTANTVLARLKAIADSLVFGIKTAANSISITPASDAVFSVTQAPITPAFLFTSTITRAANTTAYTANDTYGTSFELISSPAPTSGQWILITDIEIIFNISALPSGMAGFQLYTYGVTPPSAVVDNGAFSVPSGDRSSIIYPNGISLGSAALARGGGSVVAQANNINIAMKLTGTSFFAYLVTLAAFTPAANSETATIRVRAIAL